VVVNTCAFIDAARQESIDTVLALDDRRPPGSRLVVTGCMAERYGTELAEARDLSDQLVDAICATGVPYFDLSLQHVSKPLLRRMRRWGDGDRFLRRINDIRAREPAAAFRSNFIVGNRPGGVDAVAPARVAPRSPVVRPAPFSQQRRGRRAWWRPGRIRGATGCARTRCPGWSWRRRDCSPIRPPRRVGRR